MKFLLVVTPFIVVGALLGRWSNPVRQSMDASKNIFIDTATVAICFIVFTVFIAICAPKRHDIETQKEKAERMKK